MRRNAPPPPELDAPLARKARRVCKPKSALLQRAVEAFKGFWNIAVVVDFESDYLIKAWTMRDKTISATEAARSFSEVLNQVQYREASFSIERGKKVIARLVPAAMPAGQIGRASCRERV